MTEDNRHNDARPSRADVDDLADASFGVDTRIFMTLWDTFLYPTRVVEAAFKGDRDRYVPIIRLFLVLFGAQFALMAFADLPVGITLESLELTEESRESVALWVQNAPQCQAALAELPEAAGEGARAETIQSCRDQVNLTLERVSSLSSFPIVFLSTLPFLILLKLYSIKRSFFGHLLAYLAATNSSYVVVLPFFLFTLLPVAIEGFFWGFAFSMLWFFMAMGRILYRFYSQKVWVVCLQLLGQLLMIPIMFLIISVAQLLLVHLVLGMVHDMSLGDLFTIDVTTTPEEIS